jgi:hypothetical protein
MQRVWARGEVHTGFWWGDLREGEHMEDPGVDRKIILNLIFKKWDGGMDWIELAQNRDRWRALVCQYSEIFLYLSTSIVTKIILKL